MKKIFDGKIYELVPKSDGLIFSYRKATVDEGDVVWFKMLSLESGVMSDVGKNAYWNTKFGSNYQVAISLCENYVTAKVVYLPNDRIFICNESGQTYIINADGSVNRTGEMKYRGMPPSSVVLYKNSLWASFQEGNVLLRFSINTMRVELRIGGKMSPFVAPQGIFIEGNKATVCNSESNSLVRINLDTYAVDNYLEFEESVRGYTKINGYEFVHLDSGLYVVGGKND